MTNFRQTVKTTIKMMAVALVLAAAFCSCSSVGLEDAGEAPAKAEAAKVESIDCTNLDTSAVVDMSCMFQKCRSLQSLDLTGFSTASVIEMYRMFNECGVLQSITVDSSFIQKATELGSYEMYRLCPAQVVID